MDRLKMVNGMRFFLHPYMKKGEMYTKPDWKLTVKKFLFATRILLGG